MKFTPIKLLLLLIVLFWASSSLYIVQETQKAVVLQFGELLEGNIEPGLHVKRPWPLQDIIKFDARVLTLDAPAESFFTKQQKRLDVDSFVKWRIVDPEIYYRKISGSTVANLLGNRVNAGLRDEFGSRTLHEVVSGERDQLMHKLTDDLNVSSKKELGIEIIDVRIKRVDLPSTVSDPVYKRMRADREKLARQYRSEGKELSQEIKATANKERTVILAEAYRKSEILKGEGDAEAARTYAEAYKQDPEFYAFTRSLRAYREAFSNKGDILLVEPDNDFFRYLNSQEGK
ncbi:UNVERIFIED_CONTAM: hypothetical protein GTU68_024229 [Idotea baltica]|nr:hypothetical protein [Idotea baltica]